MKTAHEDLCLAPFGADCTCAEIERKRTSINPWADILVTTNMELDARIHDGRHTLGALRVEAASVGHSRDCARWIWADRNLPCDCGLMTGTIRGELE
jgi:hypothetical protein